MLMTCYCSWYLERSRQAVSENGVIPCVLWIRREKEVARIWSRWTGALTSSCPEQRVMCRLVLVLRVSSESLAEEAVSRRTR
jgi:hypothetical protein